MPDDFDNFNSDAEAGDTSGLGGSLHAGDIRTIADAIASSVEAEHPDQIIGEVAVVVELIDPRDETSTVIVRTETRRKWVALGLLDQARRALLHQP